MTWNPFSRRKLQTLSDDQRADFAEAIAGMLKLQLMLVPEKQASNLQQDDQNLNL
jgi:hypothetical protein